MDQESKKIALIVVWCVAAAIFFAGAGWWLMSYGKFSSYHNKQFRFSVKYPRDWQRMEHYQGTAVTFVRPKKTALDIFQPNVNITVQEVPAKVATLKSFSQTITTQMSAVFKKNIVIKEDKDVEFAGRSGHRLIVDAPEPSNLKMMFVWTIKGNIAYLFTFMAQAPQYKELTPDIDQMVKSFELK